MRGSATQILETALAGLDHTACGRSLDDFLDRTGTGRSAAGFVLFHFFRHRKAIDARLRSLMQRPPDRKIFEILEIAATQVFYCRGIAGESAVNVAVDEVRTHFSRSAAGFVNAVLRKVTAMTPPEETAPEAVLPDDVLTHWRTLFPPEILERFSRLFLVQPEAVFRYTGNGEPEASELAELHVKPVDPPVAGCPFLFYRTEDLAGVLHSPGWAAGRWYIQDPATALAVTLADFSGVHRALDICAAPGGKSMMIAERMAPGGLLVAADRSAARQKMTRENFIRRGWDYPTPVADPQDLPEHWRNFDLVLADVPCSNTGVFRHRPDALWRFHAGMTAELGELQTHLLEAAAERVAPGGQLLYSTCSIEPEENAGRCAEFLQRHPEFRSVGDFQLLPDKGHDGAYAHLMRRHTVGSSRALRANDE